MDMKELAEKAKVDIAAALTSLLALNQRVEAETLRLVSISGYTKSSIQHLSAAQRDLVEVAKNMPPTEQKDL